MPAIYYSCPRCGAHGAATVDDVGGSFSIAGAVFGWLPGRAKRDAAAAVALVRCPACHQRPRMAFARALARMIGNVALGLVVGIALAALLVCACPGHADHDDIGFCGPILAAVAAVYITPLLFGIVAALGELRRFGNVVNVTATRGRVPLPKARVISPATR